MLDRSIPAAILGKSRVQTSFSRAASSYDEWAVLQRRIGDHLLQFLNLDSFGGRTILDLGAGTGYCSRRLNRRNVCIIDLDITPAMLAKARSLEEQATIYICGDAESLPLQDRCADLVFSNLMIQWCRDLECLFKEVHRVLKPGGIFLFSTFGPETLCELRDAWKRVDFDTHVNEFFPCSAIYDALSRSGLENPILEREMMCVHYKDVMELMRALKGIGAHNVNSGRFRALTAKRKVTGMIAAYRTINSTQTISATFELIFGRCGRSSAAEGAE
ncbi:MAG: malonyl-ACP O-methyltransferase BioC [Methylococcaceae bacterium]|nr:malonyl-ACP O-methyltransferase BioC [Methylococcaceae bacterium]